VKETNDQTTLISKLDLQPLLTEQDLKRYTSKNILDRTLQLSSEEKSLQEMLLNDKNKVDYLNENIRLKQVLKFLNENFNSQLEQSSSQLAAFKAEKEEQGRELEKFRSQLEQKDLRLDQLQGDLLKKSDQLDDLYKLLKQREEQLDKTNTYAEDILKDKESFLQQMEHKDREIERLGQQLFHLKEQLRNQGDELNGKFQSLQDEKLELIELLKAEKLKNEELDGGFASLQDQMKLQQAEFDSKWGPEAKADYERKNGELDLKDIEIENLKRKLRELEEKLAEMGDVNE
jgi:chromosome segregation ATPase